MAKSRVLWLQRVMVANMSKTPVFLSKGKSAQSGGTFLKMGRILTFPASKRAHQVAKRALSAGNTPIVGRIALEVEGRDSRVERGIQARPFSSGQWPPRLARAFAVVLGA
jgi:hypothetical protein